MSVLTFGLTFSPTASHSTCAFLADVGQVVVAGHIVPLAILMGNGHHAVLPACKEVIRLVLPPVLIYLHDSKQQDSAFAFHLSMQTEWESPKMNTCLLFFQVNTICKIAHEILHIHGHTVLIKKSFL